MSSAELTSCSAAALAPDNWTAAAFGGSDAEAQGRAETLLVVQELSPNSLDMQGVGSNQTVKGLPGIATTG